MTSSRRRFVRTFSAPPKPVLTVKRSGRARGGVQFVKNPTLHRSRIGGTNSGWGTPWTIMLDHSSEGGGAG